MVTTTIRFPLSNGVSGFSSHLRSISLIKVLLSTSWKIKADPFNMPHTRPFHSQEWKHIHNTESDIKAERKANNNGLKTNGYPFIIYNVKKPQRRFIFQHEQTPTDVTRDHASN